MPPAIEFVDPTYSNNTNYSRNYVEVNVSAVDALSGLKNITIYFYNSSGLQNISISTSSPFFANFTTLPDGNYSFIAFAWDNSLNMNRTSNYTVRLDTAAPIISIQSPVNSTYNYTSIDLNFTVSGLPDSCWRSLNGGANISLPSCANATLSSLSQGSHNISVYSNDSINNINQSNVSFFVDSIPPAIEFVDPTDANDTTYNRNYIQVAVTAVDAGIGLKNISIYIYNSTGIRNISNSVSSPLSTNFTNLEDGKYRFVAFSYDNLRNLNTTYTYNVTLDTIPPAIIIDYPGPFAYNETNLSLNYTVSSDAISCQYSMDNATNYTLAGCANTTINETEGRHIATIYANDSMNNTNSANVSFIIDLTSPAINFSEPTEANDSVINRRNIIVNVTANDSLSGIKNISIYLYNETHVLVNLTNSTQSPFFVNITNLPDGEYFFNATAYDNATNRNQTATYNLTVHADPPLVEILSPTSGYTTLLGQTINIRVNSTDARGVVTSIYANITSSSWPEVSVNLSYNTTTGLYNGTFKPDQEGNYFLHIYSTDNMNNTNGSIGATMAFKIPTNTTEPTTPIDWTKHDLCPENKIEIKTLPETGVTIFHHSSSQVISFLTNSSGSGTFDSLGEGEYEITLSKSYYKTTEGTFSFTNCPPPLHNFELSDAFNCPNLVTFTIIDTTDGGIAVPGAAITFNSESKVTDEAGMVSFMLAESGTYPVLAAKAGYNQLSAEKTYELCGLGQMILSSQLTCPGDRLKLSVTDAQNGYPIVGAYIESYGSTGDDGSLSFKVYGPNTYPIAIIKDGYANYSTFVTVSSLCQINATQNVTVIIDSHPIEENKTSNQTINTTQVNITITNLTNQTIIENITNETIAPDEPLNRIEQTSSAIYNYIAGDEDKKKSSSVIILLLIAIGIFLYLHLTRPKQPAGKVRDQGYDTEDEELKRYEIDEEVPGTS